MLEVVESDFTKGLSEMVAGEQTAAATYDKETKENAIEKTTKNQDVKYKTKEAAGLDKKAAELTTDIELKPPKSPRRRKRRGECEAKSDQEGVRIFQEMEARRQLLEEGHCRGERRH